ncbi:hypothetical protein N7G274_002814 [Stereocaulon virgatum]|uniref:AD domain-containing protein n=1 Tax=Stereocaulon virgatum TaxID=373712 RepID=A0ABR4AHQ2_9LECA
MAETGARRQNAGGKAPIATPKSSPIAASGGNMSMEEIRSAAIGSSIRLHTTNPANQTLIGTLFTVCPLSNVLALSTSGGTTGSFRIIPLNSITSFTLDPLPSTTNSLPPITPLNTNTLQARARNALEEAKKQAKKINPQASREAQELFDAISRTLHTHWEKTDIVVMNQVVIKGPGYKVEDCKSGKDTQPHMLTRVKKVVDNERKRLAQKDAKGPKPVIPAVPAIPAFSGQRKGG